MKFLFMLVIAVTMVPAGVKKAKGCSTMLEQAITTGSWLRVQELQKDKRCPLEAEIATWFVMKKGTTEAKFKDYVHFIDTHSDWPWLFKIRQNAEKVIALAPPQQILAWYKKNDPKTGEGALAYLEALQILTPAVLPQSVSRVWQTQLFEIPQEHAFLKLYGDLLSPNDHARRVDYLLKQKNIRDAQRIVHLLSSRMALIANARIDLLNGENVIEGILDDLEEELGRHEGLAQDCLHWLRKNKDPRVYDFLLKYRALLGQNPESLWKETHPLARRLLEEKKYAQALRLLDNHGLAKGSDHAEAEWLRGWLNFKTAPSSGKAREIFQKLYHTVSTPISLSKAAYWVARTWEKEKKQYAREWYQKSAQFPTTFYGQLSARRLGKKLVFSKIKLPSHKTREAFNKRKLVQVIRFLHDTPLRKHNSDFLFMLVKNVPASEKALVIKLAREVDPDCTVAIAREAFKTCSAIMDESYPLLPRTILKEASFPDAALIHAVIRKESQFNPECKSSVGALGLMQVMPATGKIMEKKLGSFSTSKSLKDPSCNVKLGSAYLRYLMEKFDGSKVLTLAGYNAGPKRAAEWIMLFGDPRSPTVDMVEWIETIPFAETRNYVQRVLESYEVYKSLKR